VVAPLPPLSCTACTSDLSLLFIRTHETNLLSKYVGILFFAHCCVFSSFWGCFTHSFPSGFDIDLNDNNDDGDSNDDDDSSDDDDDEEDDDDDEEDEGSVAL
jgi:hypothetical protein